MNKVLNPADSDLALEHILEMGNPALWGRKIPGALFQYSYLLGMLTELGANNANVLVVGGYEDPIADYCHRTPGQFRYVQEVDPCINGLDLHGFLENHSYVCGTFDFVVAASVLEHVEEDSEFLDDILRALKPDGVALLTVDYKNDWRRGDPLVPTQLRFYTEYELNCLADYINDRVAWIEEKDWFPIGNYFHFGGVDYAFAAMTFRKAAGYEESI